MKMYIQMSSAAVVIGTLRVKPTYSSSFTTAGVPKKLPWKINQEFQ